MGEVGWGVVLGFWFGAFTGVRICFSFFFFFKFRRFRFLKEKI